jgi:uncharacterized protein (DUF697 family)
MNMNKSEQEAVVAIALMAAFADGQKNENEHAAIKRVSEGFQLGLVDMASLYQRVITGSMSLEQAVSLLTSETSKSLAYEVARCICEADQVMKPSEEKFLADLTTALQRSKSGSFAGDLGTAGSTAAAAGSATHDLQVIGPISDPKQPLDPVLLKYSVLTAALELLPQTAGVLAILPVQLKMVYDISQRFGIPMDAQAVKDFGAAMGVGAAGQVLEAGLRRLMSAVVGSVGGSTVGGLSGGVAGTAMTFATTYALGTVANQYYASGRKVDLQALKVEFASLLEKAKVTQAQYSQEIIEKSRQISEQLKSGDLRSILGNLVQGS